MFRYTFEHNTDITKYEIKRNNSDIKCISDFKDTRSVTAILTSALFLKVLPLIAPNASSPLRLKAPSEQGTYLWYYPISL